MRKSKVVWFVVLITAIVMLLGYSVWMFMFAGFNNTNNGMMWNWFSNGSNQTDSGSKLSVEQIESEVNNYIKGFDMDMMIDDIFVYEDSDYYVSIVETETGIGAMELLVNPYTGQIYPEFGPNMMWNIKYGMHGRNNWMGGWMHDEEIIDTSDKNYSLEEAVTIADSYVKENLNENYSVTGDGHEFYGYYTLHIYEGDETVGMLSVNYYTGDVWYHNWHGILLEEISSHED